MKNLLLAICIVSFFQLKAQQFDFYGPEPFDQILENSFNKPWTPNTISAIENKKYVVILDQASKSTTIALNETDLSVINMVNLTDIHGASSTYGSLLRSIFQMVDINTHEDNTSVPLAGEYRLNPFLHSYYALNVTDTDAASITDGGSLYIDEAADNGYVLVEFVGTPEAVTIKATSQWTYNTGTGEVVENTGWTTKWLAINGSAVEWTAEDLDATTFYLADANDLIELEIADGSDFNPLNVEYQQNATASLPEVAPMEDSPVINGVEIDLDVDLVNQLGNSSTAATAASAMLDAIEITLANAGASLRYPKEFYIAVRENMLSHKIASTDIYGGRLGYNNVGHVYFTNATDNDGVPHPFMVIAAHAVSTRPNQLVDVNRPPGAEQGVGYGESTVTRHGKLGEFLVKIPLKDYGLIDNLFDNDLSVYGDLASDFDDKNGTTTTKDVYNYTSLASIGMAVDGVTIYPAQNNNLRFAVEDGEVTHSGIHVGAGLELHYHADGHAFSGNGIALYNLADYEAHNHPPVIGMAYDGIALFGRYEDAYATMVGYDIAPDEYGGHDHGDGFGYHYHAHTQNVESSTGSLFDENFLLVGAWRGNINNIPGFEEGKFNQFKEEAIARYVGAEYEVSGGEEVTGLLANETVEVVVYPNPSKSLVKITVDQPVEIKIYNNLGTLIRSINTKTATEIVIYDLPEGVYLMKGKKEQGSFSTRFIIEN